MGGYIFVGFLFIGGGIWYILVFFLGWVKKVLFFFGEVILFYFLGGIVLVGFVVVYFCVVNILVYLLEFYGLFLVIKLGIFFYFVDMVELFMYVYISWVWLVNVYFFLVFFFF